MSVKIRQKRDKLYLDIYQNGKRTWESLHLELTKDKVQNKEIWRLAEICRSKRETQFLTGAWDISDPIAGRISLIKYMEDYAKNYKNPTPIISCVKYIKEFHSGGNIQLSQLTPKWVEDFQNFLLKKENLSQFTASFYTRVLRTILKKAVASDLLQKNPANTVKKITSPEPEMIFLNSNEVKALAAITLDDPYGSEVRRAFLFGCNTGLRISDLETLTWGRITENPMQIIKSQEKTQAAVYIPLNKSAQALISDGKKHKATDKVFNFFDRNRRMSYTHLAGWSEKAGLNKTIGWHTARRTFATLALENGADVATVAKLLGHTGLGNVMKYLKITDKLRIEAVNALPDIGV